MMQCFGGQATRCPDKPERIASELPLNRHFPASISQTTDLKILVHTKSSYRQSGGGFKGMASRVVALVTCR